MRWLAALVAAASLAASGTALATTQHRPANCVTQKPAGELVCARTQLRVARRALRYPELRRGHSVGYWRWRERVDRREIRAARHRLSHPPIAHLALWLCIHHLEAGSWYDEDTGHNGHYGGLQMSYGWDGLVVDAARLSPYQQMWAAETGFRQNSYSTSWLMSQWDHPSCLRYA